MKIAILTQPLGKNYGGILQNFALQKILSNLGFEVITLNIGFKTYNRYELVVDYVKYIILKYVFLSNNAKFVGDQSSFKVDSEVINYEKLKNFVNHKLNVSNEIVSYNDYRFVNDSKFYAFIVGSDQVWRPKYSPRIEAFFLDFLSQNSKALRISYAASFGVDCWEFDGKLTAKCKKLLAKFDSVSVRENSAISLCERYFNIKPTHVLDPTLLLNKDDYISIINEIKNDIYVDSTVAYILDDNHLKKNIVELISKKNCTKAVFINDIQNSNIFYNFAVSVEEWLYAFHNSKFIVTDSYHGIIFSIIFKKQFLCIGNKARGLSRMQSLLNIFNLQSRLIFEESNFDDSILDQIIDYQSVELLKNHWIKKSFDFLINSLKL